MSQIPDGDLNSCTEDEDTLERLRVEANAALEAAHAACDAQLRKMGRSPKLPSAFAADGACCAAPGSDLSRGESGACERPKDHDGDYHEFTRRDGTIYGWRSFPQSVCDAPAEPAADVATLTRRIARSERAIVVLERAIGALIKGEPGEAHRILFADAADVDDT